MDKYKCTVCGYIYDPSAGRNSEYSGEYAF